jgi:Xaa-Pro aminopeptidase
MPLKESLPISLYAERRAALVQKIKQEYNEKAQEGLVLLFANFEHDGASFRQDRSFLYCTGVNEPAVALVVDIKTEKSTLYIPNFGSERSKWVEGALMPTPETAALFGVDTVVYLGSPCKGYQCHPFFTHHEYADLIALLQKVVSSGKTIFTINPSGKAGYIEQRFIVQRLSALIPGFDDSIQDCSTLIAQLRRTKHNAEIELLFKAVDITIDAHDVVARAIKPGKVEYEMQAAIEYVFGVRGGSVGFPSIVASGKNGVVLHYTANNKTLEQGELVVIDIGAEYNYYCADLTRTYPVSGSFSKRQRELYTIVLDTQEYIAGLAKPGMWLSNPDEPAQSLHHLAQEFLRAKGYDKYFVHGIGHFLGLDVHDVGDYKRPLQAGDVITIEPGIYIPEENIGIRIEDNYWIVPDGVICLSENLPKSPDDIELMMQDRAGEDQEEEEPIDMSQAFEELDDDQEYND